MLTELSVTYQNIICLGIIIIIITYINVTTYINLF